MTLLACATLLGACIQAEIGDDDPWGVHDDDPVELGDDDDLGNGPPDGRHADEGADGDADGDGDADADADGDIDADADTDADADPPDDEPACIPAAEVCDNGVDEDCDGEDSTCPFVVVPVQGQCVYVTCPATHPYPVACDVTFSGNDDDGCVAWSAPWSTVYFMDGDDCDDEGGFLSGSITCGRDPGVIDEATCILRVENAWWEEEPDDC